MIAKSSWVSVVTVKCLWNDMKLVFVLNFFWAVPFSSSFSFDGPCILGWVFFSVISYLGCLCLCTIEFLYQVAINPCIFILLYWKYKNIRHFTLIGILISWVFVIYLSARKERLHFYLELHNWIKNFIFRKHIISWKLKLGLCIVFIFIYFTCWFITSLVSQPHLLSKKGN